VFNAPTPTLLIHPHALCTLQRHCPEFGMIGEIDLSPSADLGWLDETYPDALRT
jgi:hypothetical protein